MKLFAIRHGEGAAILPPPPLPQLAHLNLQYDRKQWDKSTRPARTFHKEHLPRLKYHNPGLPIRVRQGPGRLHLHFECADQDALSYLETMSLESSKDGQYTALWTPIKPKSQPPAGTGTAPPSPAAGSIFTRSVRLHLNPHEPESIWKWFQNVTKCEAFPENPEEIEQMERLNEFFAKAEIDRQLVKAGMDAVRQQRQELKQAREAAARMANEE